MRSFQEERRLRRILGSRLVFFVLILGIVFLSWKVFTAFWELRKTRSALSLVEEEIKALEEKNALLKEQISNLATEENIEKEARRLLNLKKKGEEAIIIVDELESRNGAPSSSGNETQSGVVYWIKQLFGL